MPSPDSRGGTSLLNPKKILEEISIRGGDTVADFGCGGTGHFLGSTSSMVGSEGKVYCVDIQRSVLGAVDARVKDEHISNVTTVWSDLEQVGAADIPDASCDVVMILNLLFQNKEHKNIVQEARRVLKSGGKLVVIDWKETGSPFGPAREKRVSPVKVREIASSLSMTLAQEFDAGPYHYALVFEKN